MLLDLTYKERNEYMKKNKNKRYKTFYYNEELNQIFDIDTNEPVFDLFKYISPEEYDLFLYKGYNIVSESETAVVSFIFL